MKKQKTIAIVNDISGFGRCSITVALPILSTMKIQCGILPTAILSNHTEYPEYTLVDFTNYMEEYLGKWKKLNLQFDGMYTGFLGSEKQLSIIIKMLELFHFEKRIVDPVMGDNGILYDSYTPAMCESMKQLVTHSTLTTPNVTELCILTDTPYRHDMNEQDIYQMCTTLHQMGAKQIVVTGIKKDGYIGNAIYNANHYEVLYTQQIQPLRPGTGDVFASILAGDTIRNIPLDESVQKAAHFIKTCLITSSEMNVPLNDGVCFEEHLDLLIPNK